MNLSRHCFGLSLLSFLLFTSAAWAAPCDDGFLLKQGSVMELTRYNGAHQPIGKTVSTVVSALVKDDTVTAVVTSDNYIGAALTKASTSTIDFVCDGKKTTFSTRLGNAMKDFFGKAASEIAKTGAKLVDATSFAQPQVYPLALKVGDELPGWKAFSVVVIKKAPPDWGQIAATGDVMSALIYAFTNKFAGGTQTATTNIKVVGQETCALPDKSKVPCWHISKELYAGPIGGKADLEADPKTMAKGVPPQKLDEWFAPGVGVVKLDIAIGGKVLISMGLTALTR